MESTFPASKPDWSNVEVIHRGTLAPRSYFFLFDNEEDALDNDIKKACALCLSGTWKFAHANSPFLVSEGFSAQGYDVSTWAGIQVPGIWQLQGWGHPQYTNIKYPVFVDPPNAPFDNNQTGCYVRNFDIPLRLRGHQFRLRFEGVDSAFHVWINGQQVGYSQGSRNASEFEVTALIDESETNTIAVQVYQYCDGTYLEDQDQWRFSGIFRDVYLHAFPEAHIEDFRVQTLLDDDFENAELRVEVNTVGSGTIALKLLGPKGEVVLESSQAVTKAGTTFSEQVRSPLKWTAESPNLYKLVLSFNSRTVVYNVGFRRIEIKDGIYQVNGKRIVFRGVNRHEHHPLHGRAVPFDFMKQDLLMMKKHNINAIRTCHQPSDPRLYSLADELGLWIMDEADLECHGFAEIEEMTLAAEHRAKPFQDRMTMISRGAARFTSDNPVWREQYVDRARRLVMRDKNHPCVVMWSLGNEAFYGCNFQSMYDEIRSIDQSRPIHYEADTKAQTVDLFSRMYPQIKDIIEFAKEPKFTKPLVLCEFAHAMGNGPGAIKEYIDSFYEYPRLQGGWLWEWANHGLLSKTKSGEEFYAYGGDFDDEPNDYNFVMDGVLFSNHTPTPGLIEYSKAIEPVQVSDLRGETFTIVNRYDTITLNHLGCEAILVGDNNRHLLGQIDIEQDIGPHTSCQVAIPTNFDLDSAGGERYLQLDFRLKGATPWAEAGHLVCSSQLKVEGPVPLSPLRTNTMYTPILSRPTLATLEITAETVRFVFSLHSGKITSFRKDDTEMIHANMGPELTLYRALTDNDRPQDGREWKDKLVHLAKTHVQNVDWWTSSNSVVLVVKAKIAPPALSWCINTTTRYTFSGDGSVHISCKGSPEGQNLPSTLPRIGFEFATPSSFDTVAWFGRGPGESYKDKKMSQQFGNWRRSVDDLWVDYEFPQEGGNRTDVRWVTFGCVGANQESLESEHNEFESMHATGDSGGRPGSSSRSISDKKSLTAKFGAQQGFNFSASHYTTKDVDGSTHPYELHRKKKDYVVVRLDADHHGLGTGSCGPKTLKNYALKTSDFEFDILLI
ncbi:hypothetical protein LTS08_001042 [Lithohypha guttulata]|nr:hypothetical protein LTS08_001042 [Lithohypha guttulata]